MLSNLHHFSLSIHQLLTRAYLKHPSLQALMHQRATSHLLLFVFLRPHSSGERQDSLGHRIYAVTSEFRSYADERNYQINCRV